MLVLIASGAATASSDSGDRNVPLLPTAKLEKVCDCAYTVRCVQNAGVIFKQFGGQLPASKHPKTAAGHGRRGVRSASTATAPLH